MFCKWARDILIGRCCLKFRCLVILLGDVEALILALRRVTAGKMSVFVHLESPVLSLHKAARGCLSLAAKEQRRVPLRNSSIASTRRFTNLLAAESDQYRQYRQRRHLSTSSTSAASVNNDATMPSTPHSLAPRYVGAEKNVWVEFGALNSKHNTCNLGQGFPDMKHHSPPASVKAALTQVVTGDNLFMNQYTRSYGHPRLVNALAKLYGKLLGRDIDAMTEILITVGAYGSLHAAVNGLVHPGDEVSL